jgi:rRNA processing protein Krr1/Pno1
MEIDSKFFPRIIGHHGSTVRMIREESGCEDIIIPPKTAPAGSPIRLLGTESAILKAKELIESLLK